MVFRYQPDTRRDEAVIQRLAEVAERYPRYGYKTLFQVLRRQGYVWNHKLKLGYLHPRPKLPQFRIMLTEVGTLRES